MTHYQVLMQELVQHGSTTWHLVKSRSGRRNGLEPRGMRWLLFERLDEAERVALMLNERDSVKQESFFQMGMVL